MHELKIYERIANRMSDVGVDNLATRAAKPPWRYLLHHLQIVYSCNRREERENYSVFFARAGMSPTPESTMVGR